MIRKSVGSLESGSSAKLSFRNLVPHQGQFSSGIGEGLPLVIVEKRDRPLPGRVAVRVALLPHGVRCCRLPHPQANLERPRPERGHVVLALEFQGADEGRGTPELVEGQQPQRIAHDDRHARRVDGRVPQAAEHHREGGEAQVGFGLSATSRKEQQVDHLAIRVLAVDHAGDVGEQKGELERPPGWRRLGRRGGARGAVTVSLPDRRGDGPVDDPERVEHVRLVQGLETRQYPVPGPTSPSHQVAADLRPCPVIWDPAELPVNPRRVLGNHRPHHVADGLGRHRTRQGLHPQLHTGAVVRHHLLHIGGGHPGGSAPADSSCPGR